MAEEYSNRSWFFIDRMDLSDDQKAMLIDQSYRDIGTKEVVRMLSDLPPKVGRTNMHDILYGDVTKDDLRTTALYFGVDKGVWKNTHYITVDVEPDYITDDRDYFDNILARNSTIPLAQIYDTILDTETQRVMQMLLKYRVEATLAYDKSNADGLIVVDNLPYLWSQDYEDDPGRRLYMGFQQAQGIFYSELTLPVKRDRVFAEKVKATRLGFNKLSASDLALFDNVSTIPILNEEAYGNVINLRDLFMAVPIGSVRISVYDREHNRLGWLTYDQRYGLDDTKDVDTLEALFISSKFSRWMSDPDEYPPVGYRMQEFNVSSAFYPYEVGDDATTGFNLTSGFAGGAFEEQPVDGGTLGLVLLTASIVNYGRLLATDFTDVGIDFGYYDGFEWMQGSWGIPTVDLVSASLVIYQFKLVTAEESVNKDSYEDSRDLSKDSATVGVDLLSASVMEFEMLEYAYYEPEPAIVSLDLISASITEHDI